MGNPGLLMLTVASSWNHSGVLVAGGTIFWN